METAHPVVFPHILPQHQVPLVLQNPVVVLLHLASPVLLPLAALHQAVLVLLRVLVLALRALLQVFHPHLQVAHPALKDHKMCL